MGTWVRNRSGLGYIVAVGGTSLTTALIVAFNHWVKVPNISLLYLPVILVAAVSFGTGPSLLAATVAVLEYDFFLLQPVFTLSINQVQDVLAFGVFAIVAVLTGQLAARARQRTEAARRRAAESETMYELGQALMTVREASAVLAAITQRMVDVFGVDHSSIFVPDSEGKLTLAAEAVQNPRNPRRASSAAAKYTFNYGTEVRLPNDEVRADGQQSLYVPLRTADRIVGVMEVGPKLKGGALDEDSRRLITSFAAQAALSIAQAQSEEDLRRLAVLEQTDHLKSALLSAVSHDLRTPLSSIKASATALLLTDAAWSAEEREEFLQAINDEADKLNRLVGNLLDLSRIEAGVLRPALDLYHPQEVIDAILRRALGALQGRPFSIDVEKDMSPLRLDLLRVETLVVNLLENAVKYTSPTTPIRLGFSQDGEGFNIVVADRGAGIPEHDRERIFDMFFRRQKHTDRDPGTGLGLAICRGVAEAHGGTIRVEETPMGGATFIVTLPMDVALEGAS